MQVSNSLLVQGLREKGVDVELHVFGRKESFHEESNFRKIEHNFSASNLLGHLRVARIVHARLKDAAPDMIILLDAGVERSISFLPNFMFRAKSKIISVNSGSIATRQNLHLKGKLHSWLIRNSYKVIDRIFVADATAKLLKARYPSLMPKIRNLGRPIPKSFFIERQSPRDWPPKAGLPIFLSAGRASSDKGMHLVLEALVQLRDLHGSEIVEYWYLGDGPALKEWQEFVKINSLEKVRFLGHIDFGDLRAYYEKAHFFILPSMGEMETFGRVWVEGMALGKPVVSSTLDNLVNLVSDNINGFLIETNADSVRRAIDRCLSLSVEEYSRISNEAYETASNYELSRVVERLLKMVL